VRGLYFERLRSAGMTYQEIATKTNGAYTAMQVKGMIQKARPYGALERTESTTGMIYEQLEERVLEILQLRLFTDDCQEIDTKDLVKIAKDITHLRRLEQGQSTSNQAVLVSVLDKLPRGPGGGTQEEETK